MYAHLYFPGNTSTGAQIRDITRLITSCTTTTASLSGLEFIDTNVSTVVGGNSGWSLHSSSTLPSAGATVGTSTDSNFIMQASCITSSKTKYAGVSCNGNWTNSSVVTGDDYAFNLASVLDPGTATEMWGNGYTGTSSGNGDVYGICGNTEHSDNGIHIFADSTRIFMHGKDGNNQVVWMMNAEFTETNTTQAETLVPAVQIFCNDLHSGMNISEHVTYRGDGAAIWDDQTTSYSFIQFSESNFSYDPGWYGKIRATGWHINSGDAARQNGGGSAVRNASTRSNNTQYGDNTDWTTNYKGMSWSSGWGSNPMAGSFSLWGPWAVDANLDDNTSADKGWGRQQAIAYDSSGNPGLPLFKLFWVNDNNLNHDVYDFSTPCNIWRAPAGLGATGDTVTIGSDTYVYLNTNDGLTVRPLTALLIKRT